MIFMTSNLGATEMSSLVNPKLGFLRSMQSGEQVKVDEQLNKKVAKSGVEAARRKFTPEFMNRIDKVVVFRPLGEPELRRILDLELGQVQQRILYSPADKTFVITVSESGKDFLLTEGTDLKYGARHLKRAIERLLVHPLSNLMATSQVSPGDWIQADFDEEHSCLLFTKEAEGLEVHAMANLIGENLRMPPAAAVANVHADLAKTVSAGKSSKK
jgi:ATP-dependent Clp protease ATP-binding subunit ClpB